MDKIVKCFAVTLLSCAPFLLTACGDAWTAITQPASPGSVEMEPGPLPVGGSSDPAAITTKTTKPATTTTASKQTQQIDNLINGNNNTTHAKNTSGWSDHVTVSGVVNVDGGVGQGTNQS